MACALPLHGLTGRSKVGKQGVGGSHRGGSMRISNNSHEIHVYKLGGLTFVIPPGISVTTSDGGVVITQFDVDVETSVIVGEAGPEIFTPGRSGVGDVQSKHPERGRNRRPTQSKQCCFYWAHQDRVGVSMERLCIRHQGHGGEHSDMAGNRPTQAEDDAGKEDDAADV